MKYGLKKSLVSIILGSVGVMGLFSSVHAWTAINGASSTSATDLNLYAGNGDVVTTDKWNQLVSYIKFLYGTLADWPRNKTPFVWQNTPVSIGGADGYYVNSIGLGYNPAGSYLGSNIGFYDASKGYYGSYNNTGPDSAQALGQITFSATPKSLTFMGFTWGIFIAPGSDATTTTTPKLIGWEKINPYDSAPFDPNCQYRVTSNGTMWNATLVWSVLDNNGNLSNGMIVPANNWLYGIWGENKAGYWTKSHIDQPTSTDPWIYHTVDAAWKIEKLCLPAYNPNGY